MTTKTTSSKSAPVGLEKKNDDDADAVRVVVHADGFPPWHAVGLVIAMVAVATALAPPWTELDDEIAKLETFTHRIFPDWISLSTLIAIRTVMGIFILANSVQDVMDKNGIELVVPYVPHTRLKRGVKITLKGIRRMAPFTMWSWNLLGISFLVSAYLAYCGYTQPQRNVSPVLLRAGVLLFEIVGPMALLVAFVVRYAIWPSVLKHGGGRDPTSVLKTTNALLYHNLNVVLVLAEVSLLGGLPVRLTELYMPIYFGSCYIVFAWTTRLSWVDAAQHGPQFLYHFLDTTLGITTTLSILVLLITLVVFYALFCVLHQCLDEYLGGGLWTHVAAVVAVSSVVCRFRD